MNNTDTDITPLSRITEQLQSLAKSKADDSIFTGSEFKDEYTTAGMPNETRNTVAYAGGDIQTAYSNLYSIYETARDRNNNREKQFQLDKETQDLNMQRVIGKLQIADEKLHEAHQRITTVQNDIEKADSLQNQIQNIRNNIQSQIQLAENTGCIVVRN